MLTGALDAHQIVKPEPVSCAGKGLVGIKRTEGSHPTRPFPAHDTGHKPRRRASEVAERLFGEPRLEVLDSFLL